MAEFEIIEWYRGKTVFITGATGFMGKVLLEKLLRSCHDIGPIYILVCDKKKMLPRDRVEKMMSSKAFDEVRALRANWEDWVIPIPGDISKPDLGISTEHRRLLQENVSVVYHLAATVRFDEPLRIALTMNVEATRALMNLCLGMTQISAIVHVSTAYTNCNLSSIEERIYPPPADLDKVTHCVAGMDDDLLEINTPRLIGNRPNTYIFTKALAEQVVADYSSKLPVVVVRPSIVSAARKEPSPGWVDSYNGATALVAGGARGLLTSVYGQGWLVADLIPVDVCVNLCIAAAWDIGTNERKTPVAVPVLVYNCVSRPFKSITWNEFVHEMNSCMQNYPVSEVLTSPSLEMTDSRIKYTLAYALEHALPATIVDMVVQFCGGIPRFRSYQRQVKKAGSLVEFFVTHEFEFQVKNVERLSRRLSPADKTMFNFEMRRINWKEYITAYFLGMRKHLMREEDDTIRMCRQRICRRVWLKKAVQIGMLAIGGITCILAYF